MMFILAAIQCVAEEKAALWQEERAIKRMSRGETEEEQKTEENPDGEDETADNSLDDLDEYLRECALGVLAPLGKPDDDGIQEELKTIVQSIKSKLSEEDKKRIIDSLNNKKLSVDVNKLFGVRDKS